MSVLPHTLLILVHLHLLDYPLKDSSAYDERLFDPTRTGIRERTKALEDVSYFLVAKVEGSKGRARSVFPSYPCLQPSDTTAFRISLAKYLETLRHSTLYPSHGEDRQKGKDETKIKSAHAPQKHAWWWQDVVVRKSLLEECSGERFERLLLALSIHALFVNTTAVSVPGSISQTEVSIRTEALQTLPQEYACLLEMSQSARRGWERSASRLVQQHEDLSVLRERLLDPTTALSSQFDSLSTGRLVALRDSRLYDLLRTTWKDDGGRRALHFLIDLAGLEASPAANDASRPLQTLDVAPDKADVQYTPPTPVPAPPLPIAAAHHPANLSSLKAPLFSPPTKSLSANAAAPEANTRSSQDPTRDRLAERLASIQRTRQALLDAALRTDNVLQDLERRSRKVHSAVSAHPPPALVTGSSLDVGIWEAPSRTTIDFKTPSEAPSSSTAEPPADTAVEERIARIRTTLLPAYPEAPSPVTLDLDVNARSSVSTAAASASRLLQPSERGTWRPQGSKDNGSDTRADRYQPARAANVAVKVHRPNLSGKMDKPRTLDIAPGARGVSTKVSRRASAARARRTTLLSRHNLYDDEVSEILDAVEDGSPPTYADSAQTPKAKPGTAGNLLSTVKKTLPRPSFDIERHERAIDVPLPKLRLSALDTHDLHAEMSSKEREPREPLSGQDEHADADEDFYEGHSVTLRDILLNATDVNGAQYDLLGEEEDGLGDDAFEW